MRSFLFLLFSSILCLGAYAQPYGNEWINYSSKYYYFPVVKEGIYRIDSTALANAIGSSQLAALDPRNLQVFARGVEVPIHLPGESDGQFNSGDFIEFYARGNDGTADSVFFDSTTHQANPFLSQFNDTIYYYITWNSSITNLRAVSETDIAFASYTAASWFWRSLRYSRSADDAVGYVPKYYYGERLGAMSDPRFGKCSGWMDNQVGYGGTRTIAFPTPGVYTAGPNAQAEVYFTSQTNATQYPDHHMQVLYNNTQLVYDTIFDGFQAHKVQFNIAASVLPATTGIKVHSKNDLVPAPASQAFAVGYGLLRYPHNPHFENKFQMRIILPEQSGQSKYYLNATGFPGTNAVLYDVSNGRKIVTVTGTGTVQALIPNTGIEKYCYIADESVISSISNIQAVSPTAQFTDFSTFTGNFLLITNPTLWNAALTYAAYRNLSGHDPVIADVEELYHQFGYGIRKHPISIRNFVDYAQDNWQDTLQHLFLFGKSIHANEGRFNASRFAACLVPSVGARSSDVLLTAGINGSGWSSSVATGRLAAQTESEANAYLDKVKLYEQQIMQPESWMKTVGHFHGGSYVSEQFLLSAFLNGFKSVITDTLTGMRVLDFYKSTTAPVQSGTLFDTIRKTIESGTSLLTFFGHAAGSSFDINIDNAASYNNYGKYPFILANSCLVGDIHLFNTGIPTTSEDFVLSPGRGAIGFIASVGLGSANELNTFSTEFYRQLSIHNYGGAIGTSLKQATEKVESVYLNHPVLRFNIQQMNYHGDPALHFPGWEKPDLSLSPQDVWTIPSIVSTDMDSFDLKVVVQNKARAFNEAYVFRITRTYLDGHGDTLIQHVQGARFADTLNFTFPVNILHGGGINTFHLIADESSLIDEWSELNNEITFQLQIRSEDIIPVWPLEFAVVPGGNITLKASTGDPFLGAKDYRFEIDTNSRFLSPAKESQIVNATGGVVKFTPNLTTGMPDSTVFYWRVRPDSSTTGLWKSSSFQVINGKKGWGQADGGQFEKNGLNFLEYDTLNHLFVFDSTARHLVCNNIGNPATPAVSYGIEYKIDANIEDYAGCGWSPALHVVVIDSITLQPWGKKWTNNSVVPPFTHNPTHDFGNANNENNCRNRVEKYFIFQTANPVQMDSMASMISNHVEDGHYVLIYSYLNAMQSQWTPSLISAMSGLGASSNLTSGSDSLPFIFFTRKGNSQSTQEIIGTDKTDIIQLTAPLYGSIPYGTVLSEPIGPALSWDALFMKQVHLEPGSPDSSAVSIYGITLSGNEVFIANFSGDDVSELNLSSLISPSVYPYVRLVAHKQDDSLRTAPQLYNWHLLYEPAPEIALNPAEKFSLPTTDFSEGQLIQASIAVTNISQTPMDSTVVTWYIEDDQRNRHVLQYQKEGSLPADSSIVSTLSYSSLGHVGHHTLFVEANPRDGEWEREGMHFNNLGFISINIDRDQINSLLDVTFDGIHILNRDIVSPRSTVVIQLSDENKYIALNDTAAFRIYLTKPDGTVSRLWFGGATQDVLFFSPANLPDNSCRVTWHSDLQEDGIYKLQVQATDAAQARELDYAIEFEVIQKSTITHIMNYPNPFSTSTRFVFTLTGSEIPDDFRIQILTVTGKVIREIHRIELGDIRIGRNISEYAWDGRDEFGDQLANGIYLYRVITGIQGQNIEHRASGADSYFTKGFGKMYLLRGK